MDFLCNVTVEHRSINCEVTVFDFPQVLEETERRVQALLGYGPQTVAELREYAGQMRKRYAQRLLSAKNRKINIDTDDVSSNNASSSKQAQPLNLHKVAEAVTSVGAMTGSVLKTTGNVLLATTKVLVRPAVNYHGNNTTSFDADVNRNVHGGVVVVDTDEDYEEEVEWTRVHTAAAAASSDNDGPISKNHHRL